MIEWLLQVGISNAVGATVLAMVVCIAAIWVRRPPLLHALWLIVLVKFVAPPLYWIDIPVPDVAVAAHMSPDKTEKVSPQARDQSVDTVEPPRIDQRIGASGQPQLQGLFAGAVERIEIAETPPLSKVETGIVEREQVRPIVVDSPKQDAMDEVEFVGHHSPSHSAEKSLDLRRLVQFWVFIAWVAGSAVWLTIALIRLSRFNRLVRQAKDAPDWIVAEVVRLARQLGLRHNPQVRSAQVQISPLVWAIWGRPIIVLPVSLLASLDRPQISSLLIHELAHVRRRDPLVRWLELAILSLYWWCPFAWFARRQLRRAEEDCCDAWVAWLTPNGRQSYASALLCSAELISARSTPLPLTASGLSSATLLQRRIEMILHHRSPRCLGGIARLVILVAAVVLLPLSAELVSQDTAPAEDIAIEAAADAEAAENALPATDSVATDDNFEAPSDLLAPIDAGIGEPVPADDVISGLFGNEVTPPTDPANAGADDSDGNRLVHLAGHAVLARATLANGGREIELRYTTVRKLNSSDRVGERISRMVERSHRDRLAVREAHVELIGEGRLSANEVRHRLRSRTTVLLVPHKNQLLGLLREGTVVIVGELGHVPLDVERRPGLNQPTIEQSQFPPSTPQPDLVAGEDSPESLVAPADVLPPVSPDAPPNSRQPAGVPTPNDTPQPSLPPPGLAPAQPSTDHWPLPLDPAMPRFGPSADENETNRRPIVLKMDTDGNVLVLGQKTPLERLKQILSAMSFLNTPTDVVAHGNVSRQQSPEVVLQMPESISASHAVKLIQMCEEAGFTKLRLQVNGNQRPRPVSR